jgi:hypothetical protein
VQKVNFFVFESRKGTQNVPACYKIIYKY